jgi:putative ABC transport system substrate-binding protein
VIAGSSAFADDDSHGNLLATSLLLIKHETRRREFITLLSAAAAAAMAAPLAARAQQTKVIRIGFLGPNPTEAMGRQYQAFLAELRDQGFRQGQNLLVSYGRTDEPRGIRAVAAELLQSQPDLIVATGPEDALQAVVSASRSIPVVFLAVQFDPIARGYVTSLARPGGNITGVFYRQPELAAKQLEILVQAFPDRTRLGVLYDANSADQFSAAADAAKSMPLQLRALRLENPPYDFAEAFATIAREGSQMVLVLSSPLFVAYHKQIADAAIAHRLPTMFVFRAYVADGGLMSYGVEQIAMFRRIGDYVARILKGTNPADLPVEQPTKFEFVVNLKTAKAIGIELPTATLLRADEVIE